MSITDELRDYALSFKNSNDSLGGIGDDLDQIADRIDEEHEKAVMGAMNDALCHANEESMAKLGWVRLPKDADGVPFRIGDKVDSDHYEDGTVTGIQSYKIYNGGIRTLIAVRPDGWDVAMWHTPDEYRHHHEPTVEGVLREFVERWHDTHHDDIPALFAEYDAKLRLAEGEDA